VAAARFWVRWAARDLRARWVQVLAIALVIGVGTGVYAGLGSTSTWRRQSNDESYAALRMHDVRAALAEGVTVDQGRLLDALAGLPAGTVATAEERLLAPTQVDASTAGRGILVPGQLVGLDLAGGGPHVDGLHVEDGRTLAETDRGRPVGVLERHFAEYYDLPPSGDLRLAGGQGLRYEGTGLAPEYFMVTTKSGNVLAEANFAAVFVSLETAQALAGRPGQVNDLVVRLGPGVDRVQGRELVERALAGALPDAGATVTVREQDDAYRILYKDISSDQKFWNVIAALILTGAVVAAFNLVSRMVEAQRRQIGVGMALGTRPSRLALRPVVAGLEIAVLGVGFGVGVGLLVGQAMRALFTRLLPMPVWRTSFQPRFFLAAAALGVALPLLATVWPVWRALRVAPVVALRTSHLAARGPRLASLGRRLPLPGRTVGRMPVRNVLRAPRRTLLTSLGIAAAMCALVATLGMIDSFEETLDRGEAETLGAAPDRLTVELDRFHPVGGPVLGAITGSPAVAVADAGIRVGGELRANGVTLDAMVDVLDLHGGLWRPTILRPAGDVGDGVVISEKAAEDLGVAPGGTVVLRHPRRSGAATVFVESELTVTALHPNPLRFAAYVDRSQAGPLLGMEGLTNLVALRPAAGHSDDDVKQALFGVPGVASVQPAGATTKLFRELIDEFVGVLRIVELFALVLALLIAFNASSISADERARDHATMFAFGLRVRTVARMGMVEGLVTGVLGTAVGVLAGSQVIGWIVHGLLAETVPEFGLAASMSGGTVLAALAVGVVAVALAPLLTVPRMRRMDLPSTLRVME
jgi:putative ABC transport system permease protein